MTSLPPRPGALTKPSEALPNAYLAYLNSLSSQGSKVTMAKSLRRCARLMGLSDATPLDAVPWHALRYDHLTALRARMLEDGLKPATVNVTLASLRGVINTAFALGLIDGDTAQRALKVKGVKDIRPPAGREVTLTELQAVVAACDTSTDAGARDLAVLALGYGGGLRRHEIAGVRRENFDRGKRQLTVKGKGGVVRLVPLSEGLCLLLDPWLKVRGDAEGPLLESFNRDKQRLNKRGLSPDGVGWVVQAIQARAGLAERFTPHDLRRTFATVALDNGVDLNVVKDMLGHQNIATTARYDRRGERAKTAAAEKIPVPALGRQA